MGRRSEILQRATEVFERKGVTHTSLEDIAREVGIKREDIERIVKITVDTDNGLNPGPVTLKSVRHITEGAFEGARPE